MDVLKTKKVKKYLKKIPWIYENHFLYFKLNSNNINEGSYNELCRKTVRKTVGKGQSCCMSAGWTVVHYGNGGFFPFFLTLLVLFTFIPMRPMSFKQHGSGKGKLLRVLLSQQNILCGKVGVDEKVRVRLNI